MAEVKISEKGKQYLSTRTGAQAGILVPFYKYRKMYTEEEVTRLLNKIKEDHYKPGEFDVDSWWKQNKKK